MSRSALLAILLGLVAAPAAAQTINLTTDPASAKIYRIEKTGIRTLLGTGAARVKVEKQELNQIVIEAEGYQTLMRSFPHGEKYPKNLKVTLENRLIKVTALPYDAQILLNGKVIGTQAVDVIIPPDAPATVEVKKPGFRTVSKTYRNQDGADAPPLSENFELRDRVVLVTSRPSEAQIAVDGTTQGDRGAADVVVPFDKCVNVRVSLLGYKPEEQRFCNKEQAQQPVPLNAQLDLRDRLTNLHTTPSNAGIKVDGRQVATGDFALTVPKNQCVEVIVAADGYASQKKQYCNQVNMPDPPTDEHIALPVDEAYSSATLSDQANVNFTIEVSPAKRLDSAWSTISQIIMNKFDVLEVTDKETGYMRTAWQVNYFPNSTVRTRVIIKLGSAKPLKFIAKVASEHADGHANIKDDEAFKEWGWILNSYKDIINELQARLR